MNFLLETSKAAFLLAVSGPAPQKSEEIIKQTPKKKRKQLRKKRITKKEDTQLKLEQQSIESSHESDESEDETIDWIANKKVASKSLSNQMANGNTNDNLSKILSSTSDILIESQQAISTPIDLIVCEVQRKCPHMDRVKISSCVQRMWDTGMAYDKVDSILAELSKEKYPSKGEAESKESSVESSVEPPKAIHKPPPLTAGAPVAPGTGSVSGSPSKLPLSSRLELVASYPNLSDAVAALCSWASLMQQQGPGLSARVGEEFFACRAPEILLHSLLRAPGLAADPGIRTGLAALLTQVLPLPVPTVQVVQDICDIVSKFSLLPDSAGDGDSRVQTLVSAKIVQYLRAFRLQTAACITAPPVLSPAPACVDHTGAILALDRDLLQVQACIAEVLAVPSAQPQTLDLRTQLALRESYRDKLSLHFQIFDVLKEAYAQASAGAGAASAMNTITPVYQPSTSAATPMPIVPVPLAAEDPDLQALFEYYRPSPSAVPSGLAQALAACTEQLQELSTKEATLQAELQAVHAQQQQAEARRQQIQLQTQASSNANATAAATALAGVLGSLDAFRAALSPALSPSQSPAPVPVASSPGSVDSESETQLRELRAELPKRIKQSSLALLEYVTTERKCISVISHRVQTSRAPLLLLQRECEAYKQLNMKHMIVDSEAAIGRMTSDLDEDMKSLEFLQHDIVTELVSFASKLSICVPGASEVSLPIAELKEVAELLRRAGVKASLDILAFTSSTSTSSSTAPVTPAVRTDAIPSSSSTAKQQQLLLQQGKRGNNSSSNSSNQPLKPAPAPVSAHVSTAAPALAKGVGASTGAVDRKQAWSSAPIQSHAAGGVGNVLSYVHELSSSSTSSSTISAPAPAVPSSSSSSLRVDIDMSSMVSNSNSSAVKATTAGAGTNRDRDSRSRGNKDKDKDKEAQRPTPTPTAAPAAAKSKSVVTSASAATTMPSAGPVAGQQQPDKDKGGGKGKDKGKEESTTKPKPKLKGSVSAAVSPLPAAAAPVPVKKIQTHIQNPVKKNSNTNTNTVVTVVIEKDGEGAARTDNDKNKNKDKSKAKTKDKTKTKYKVDGDGDEQLSPLPHSLSPAALSVADISVSSVSNVDIDPTVMVVAATGAVDVNVDDGGLNVHTAAAAVSAVTEMQVEEESSSSTSTVADIDNDSVCVTSVDVTVDTDCSSDALDIDIASSGGPDRIALNALLYAT